MAQATLHGTLTSDGGEACTVWFEWGLTAQYGKNTPFVYGLRAVYNYSYVLTGLNNGTVYHYRAVAQNSVMVVYGNDVIFVTPENPHMMVLIQDEMAEYLTMTR